MKLSVISLCSKPSKAAIWLSNSRCIYENLAFEDWLFRNVDFQGFDGLLLWRNRPAVVIGKHQNCFVESDVNYAKTHDIDVARRNSGGGTVYHDLNNVNISFFTARERHKRLENLFFMQSVLKNRFNIDVEITNKHDLLFNGSKVSGTAAKLSGKNSYHHLTLLIDYNLNHMKHVLKSSFRDLENSGDVKILSKATQSIRADRVGRLMDAKHDLCFDNIAQVVVQDFSTRYKEVDEIRLETFDEKNFVGVGKVLRELKSWDWIFGLNPPFEIEKMSNAENEYCGTLNVEKGLIAKFSCNSKSLDNYWSKILTTGARFNVDLFADLFVKHKDNFRTSVADRGMS